MKKKVEKSYQLAKTNYFFWRKEIQTNASMKVSVKRNIKIKMWNKGFLGEAHTLYNLGSNDSSNYLSDKQRIKSNYINGKYAFILNNKIVFEKMYKDLLAIPETSALIMQGKIIAVNNTINDIDSLIEYLKNYNKVVIKPISGGGGFGVRIIKLENGNIYSNNKLISKNELSEDIKKMDDYFISEFIKQGDFASSFNPETLNSMRIITMIDPETNKAFIPIAVQRIGTNESAPADNWTQGGISAEIDVETGVLSKGATYPSGSRLSWNKLHPDTDAEIEGVSIPDWNEIKEIIINTANTYPYMKYIGWDVVHTDEGIMVIEANNCTDVNLLQIHRPLLEDERMKTFYKYYNVI